MAAAEELFNLYRNATYFQTRTPEQKQQLLAGWAEIIGKHAAAALEKEANRD